MTTDDRDPIPPDAASAAATEPVALSAWLRQRAHVGVAGNLIVFTLVAATAASRAAHGVLSPAALVAVVVGSAVAASATGWATGFYEGAEAALLGRVGALRPAQADQLRGTAVWQRAAAWSGLTALWSASGAVVMAAVLGSRSAPFLVVVVALAALAAPAAVVVDIAARAAGAASGALLRTHRPAPVGLLHRAWFDLAAPIAVMQVVVNAGAAWVLFHGAASDGTLTKGAAFADALVVSALLAALFGALGARWGAVEAGSGRVAPPMTGSQGAHPIGPQALVYTAGLGVMGASLLGVLLPAEPSVMGVAILRGALAGVLTLVACALGVVRGASNAAPLGLDPARPAAMVAPAGPAGRFSRRVGALVTATAAIAVLAVGATPLVHPAPAEAGELAGLGLGGELDAFAVRVEYDIPAPVSSGSIPQVVGAVRRSAGSESANGIAGAPSRLDAVVGGTVSNPDKESDTGDEMKLPQSECAYPGDLADVSFTFPADLRPDTAGSPPAGWSSAQCAAGPELQLHAVGASPGRLAELGPAVEVGAGVADGFAGPHEGTMAADASASASAVSILGGIIEIESITARGRSITNGRPGGASSEASVEITGMSVAGARFDVRDGDLVVDGTALPAGSAAAGAALGALSAAVAPSGCEMSFLDSPAAYPQGFLFSRPEPELGVSDDGTTAGSMTGGLLVQCDIPHDLAAATGFSPQRAQIMLGFVYTSVTAREDIGGFGLGHIGGGTADGGSGPGLATPTVAPFPAGGVAEIGPIVAPVGSSAQTRAGTASDGDRSSRSVTERIELLAANFAAGRPWLWVAALVLWLLLSHRGFERLRAELDGTVA